MQCVSDNENEFVLSGIESETRLDGRGLMETRRIKVILGETCGLVEVICGDTHIVTKTTAEITVPKPERPNEGSLKFNVDLSALTDEQQPHN